MPKFVPRQRKHKREQHELATQNDQAVHANGEVHERRRHLQDELRSHQQPRSMSSQKKKRLEKYIDTKLKKEENLELLKKLAAQKVDTSLLQSAKKLGRVSENKRERLSRALRERKAGVDVDGQQDAILFETRKIADVAGNDQSSNDEFDAEFDDSGDIIEVQVAQQPSLSFGSGLKRPLETDSTGRPLIKRRKRRKSAEKQSQAPVVDLADERIPGDSRRGSYRGSDSSDESEWNGFESDQDEQKRIPDQPDSNATSHEETEDATLSDDADNAEDNKAIRISAFKAWADSQRDQAIGFTRAVAPINNEKVKASFVPRALSPDLVATELFSTASEKVYRPQVSVVVARSEEIQTARLNLPVVQDEQKIIESIHNNAITIICGATGSGKTTQLPQMLLENGYASSGMIGVTQPRRIAATSVANRVVFELGPEFRTSVAHQVRYDSNVGRDTKIKFMTDGILLREISYDFTLSKYSAIVVDEAHERSVNTDILIGMLSRIVPLRQELSCDEPDKYRPLKLIIMSATMRVADFLLNARLFKSTKPPVVQADGRQYQVTEHFARRTQRDYLAEMVNKVSRGHRKLPPGAILVFLTGQDEIHHVAKQLKAVLRSETTDFFDSKGSAAHNTKRDFVEGDETEGSDAEAEITGLDDEDAEFEFENDPFTSQERSGRNAHILSLYAALPAVQQMKVFQPPPEDSRVIILATNVAETSLTIPGVRYVFDCGRSKEKRYDPATGVQEFRIDWISKASASQRMGRAGRTGPGHCYRLYSSAIYERYFEDHSLPEILRTPIEGTVLQLKSMNVDNVLNFPFPTPPQTEQLFRAEKLLQNLGAIDCKTGKVTVLGEKMIHYPVNPRFAKMLLLGKENKILSKTIALVAGLAVGDLFLPEPRLTTRNPNANVEEGKEDNEGEEEEDDSNENMSHKDYAKRTYSGDFAMQKRKQAFGRARGILSSWDDKSDALKVLVAVALHAQAEMQGNAEVLNAVAAQYKLEARIDESLCQALFLKEKGMEEVHSLRRQLHDNTMRHDQGSSFRMVLDPPVPGEVSMLKQIVACGYLDQVAIRADLLPSATTGHKPRRAIDVAYRTLLPSISDTEVDHTAGLNEQQQQKGVYVHSGSVLARMSVSEMPSYIIFSHLSRATAKSISERASRIRIHPLTTIGPKQLARLAEGTPLLEVGKPIGKIEDKAGGKKRECWVPVSVRDPNAIGTSGWPLGAWKVVQSRNGGKEWKIEVVLDRGK